MCAGAEHHLHRCCACPGGFPQLVIWSFFLPATQAASDFPLQVSDLRVHQQLLHKCRRPRCQEVLKAIGVLEDAGHFQPRRRSVSSVAPMGPRTWLHRVGTFCRPPCQSPMSSGSDKAAGSPQPAAQHSSAHLIAGASAVAMVGSPSISSAAASDRPVAWGANPAAAARLSWVHSVHR